MQGKLRQEGWQAEANFGAAGRWVSPGGATWSHWGPMSGMGGCVPHPTSLPLSLSVSLSFYLCLSVCLCLDLCLSSSLSLCLSASFAIPLSLVVPLAEQVVQGKAVSVAELRPPVKCLLPL